MESTNRIILNASQDEPKIIGKYSETVFTTISAAAYYGDIKYIDTSHTTEFSSNTNYAWDIYVYDVQRDLTITAPIMLDSGFSTIAIPVSLISYIDDDSGKLRINLKVAKLDGLVTDSYVVNYVLYSTKISDDITL